MNLDVTVPLARFGNTEHDCPIKEHSESRSILAPPAC